MQRGTVAKVRRQGRGNPSGSRTIPAAWLGRSVVALCAALFGASLPGAALAAAPAPPALHARSAAILDMRDGSVLWSENGRLRLPMASTTKLMTALVSLQLEHGRMSTPMVVPPQVSQAYGEILYLRPGDQYTYQQLFEGMLLPSANDAAIAIAVDSAGSLSGFVRLMNRAAVAYGLRDTHYANPDGLDAPNHYTSADDLARLGWVAMNNPTISSVVAMTSATIPWPRHGTRLIGNINALLGQYPGATGVKTGYTSQAMNVIVGSAQRNGQSVIAVLMGEPAGTFWQDEAQLLNYAFVLAAARGPVASAAPPVYTLATAGAQSGTATESAALPAVAPDAISAAVLPAAGTSPPAPPAVAAVAAPRRPAHGGFPLPVVGAVLLLLGSLGLVRRARRLGPGGYAARARQRRSRTV